VIRRGTYSVVAADPRTGAVGVAVQSHWFAVGPIVPWVRTGVGAVATQSVAEPSYGPRLLDLLEEGRSPQDALEAVLAEDAQRDYRQVAVIDARGQVAVHTGRSCIAYAGHARGANHSAQANMMAGPEVWPAMSEAFERAAGPLQRRLAAALHAAEDHGGDARGQQSACILVAPGEGEPWRTAVDLRVDDHATPLKELDRLLDLRDAYDLATQGDELAAEGRFDDAADRYERAAALAPDNHELLFWAGLAAAQKGDMPRALQRVRRAIELQPGWRDLLERLKPDIAPAAPAVLAALQG
jgi:uncharacterized Ntn-hydrolase superfamily protein